MVEGYDEKNKRLIISERNYFSVGDKIEIFTPKGESYKIEVKNIYDKDDNPIDVARHPKQTLKLDFPKELEKYSMIRICK